MSKKDQILQKTLELVVNQGIQETPMSQISKDSGIAVGTIYHHFKSKKEIINYIYLQIKKQLAETQMLNVKEDSHYKMQFFQIWNNLFAFYVQNELKYKFLEHIGPLPIIEKETRVQGLDYSKPMMSFYEKGVKTEILKPIDLHLLSETIHGNVVSLVRLYHQKAMDLDKKTLLQTIIMSWDAVATN